MTLLYALGRARPTVIEVGADLSCATVVVPIPVHAPSHQKLLLTLPDPSLLTLDAVLVPIEAGHPKPR